MTPHTLRPEVNAVQPDRPPEPGRQSRLRAGALLGVILATAVVGSLLVVPASGVGAQNQDSPTEDITEEEPTTEGAQPSEEPSAGECAQPPPSLDEADVAGWSASCIDSGYWVVELTCGEAYTHAGRRVRFTTAARRSAQPSLYELCGYVECPPTALEAAGTRTDDLAGAGNNAEESERINVIEADSEPTTGGRAASEDRCGAPWPPGTWHETAQTDPVTGAENADARLSGRWLGVHHHRALAVPSLAIDCVAGGLAVALHTGGDIAAAYGHGVPVEYRIGDTVRFEEWVELPTSPGRDAGVSLPQWLTGEFVTLLRDNVGAEFVIRVFGYDGTPVGTASFDLGGIDQPAESVFGLCGV